jgi:hypothetical protein
MRAILGLLTLLVLGLVFFVVPPAEGLGYYVRLAFFHIPVAWVAVLAFFISAFEGGRFLQKGEMLADAKSAAAAPRANLTLLAIDDDRCLLPDADDVEVLVVHVADLLEPAVARGSRNRAVAGCIEAQHAEGRGLALLGSDAPVPLRESGAVVTDTTPPGGWNGALRHPATPMAKSVAITIAANLFMVVVLVFRCCTAKCCKRRVILPFH